MYGDYDEELSGATVWQEEQGSVSQAAAPHTDHDPLPEGRLSDEDVGEGPVVLLGHEMPVRPHAPPNSAESCER